jgi:hypothetical protein
MGILLGLPCNCTSSVLVQTEQFLVFLSALIGREIILAFDTSDNMTGLCVVI